MRKSSGGFSLVELLTALFIVCILVIALTVIYDASIKTLSVISVKLEKGLTSSEIMRLIVDDIVKVSSGDSDTSFSLKTKMFNNVALYRFEIISKIYDNTGKELFYRKVIWQSDYDSNTGTISLYRCMGGMAVEDPILSTQAKENPDTDIFVPVCRGLTYFTVQVPQVQDTPEGPIVNYVDQWASDEMPGGVAVTLSFTPPVEYVTGQVEVPVEDRTVETVSVNRSKQYKFQFVAKDLEAASVQEEEKTDEEMTDDEKSEQQQSGQQSKKEGEGETEQDSPERPERKQKEGGDEK